MLSACDGGSDGDATLNVFAAASLAVAFDELAVAFETVNPEVRVILTTGGSSTLAAQIREGAPADVFAAADLATMQKLLDAGLVASRPQVFATNSAAILVAEGNPLDIDGIEDLAGGDVIVVQCAPEVPCGAYATEIYERAGVTVTPRSFEQSVSGVVGKISLGEADAGIVYVTDVLTADDAEGVTIPADVNVVAEYPIAVLGDAREATRADAFMQFVLGDEGRRVLVDHGFGTP